MIYSNRYKLNFLWVYAAIALFASSCATAKKPKSNAKSKEYIAAFHEAVRLKVVGDVDGSVSGFEKCLAMRQDDDAVYFALSQLMLAKSDLPKSAEYIKKAQEIDPKNIWYTEEVAYMYFELGKYPESAKEFKKLIEYEPQNTDWLYSYADCLYRQGKLTESIGMLDKAEEIMGINPQITLEKYNLYMRMKKPNEALLELKEAQKEFPEEPSIIATIIDHYFKTGETDKAVSYLEELVRIDPSNGRAHLALGDIYRQQGKMDKCYFEWNQAFQSLDVDIDTKTQILIGLQQGMDEIPQEAMQLMELTATLHDDKAQAHSIKGDYLLTNGDKAGALAAYKRALSIDPDLYPIWNQVLTMEYQAQDFESLYVDASKCMEYFPNQNIVYLFKGVACIYLKKPDEAIDVLTTGLAYIINDKYMEAEFMGQLGEAHFAKKSFSEGNKFFTDAIKLDPRSNLIKNNYAYRLATNKIDLEKAKSLITQALQNSPGNPSFMDTRGFIAFQSGDYESALNDFKQAYQAYQENAEIAEHVGDAYAKLNNVNEALKYWQIAQELGSKNSLLPQKIQDKKFYEPLD